MSTRRADADVHARLLDHFDRYTFDQAVRLLEHGAPPECRVGRSRPSEERVRLRPHASLGFPASDIHGIEVMDDAARHRITTTFLGLVGVDSPLPSHYAEDVACADEDGPVRAFLDLFHHRLLSLLYRAVVRHRIEVAIESGADEGTEARRLGALAGLDPEADVRSPTPRPPSALTWVLAHASATAAGLTTLAAWVLGAPVEVEQCVPRSVRIDAADRSRLGRAGSTLGRAMVLGEQVLDRSSTCRLIVGPLEYAEVRALLPGGELRRVLQRVAVDYLGPAVICRLSALIRPDTVPPWTLKTEGDSLLGFNTWSGRLPATPVSVELGALEG
jgi:type VI secretion system protein ImpH